MPIQAAIVVALAAGLASNLAQAVVYTWDFGGGTDTNWSTGLNWNGTPPDTVPSAGADVTFPAAAGATATLDTNATVGLITFAATASSPFKIEAGGGTLTINTGITQTSNGLTNTINAPVVIGGGPQTWTFYNGGKLIVNGSISGSSNVKLDWGGGGAINVTLSGDNSGFSGGFNVGVGGKINSSDNPNKILILNANGANSLGTGLTTVGYDYLLNYTAGALTTGGSVQVNTYGQAALAASGAIGSSDVFNVATNGVLSGDATRLGGLTRGTNMTLAAGAILGHKALNQATANSLGSNADLLFGIAGNFSTAASRDFGANTPWNGIAAGAVDQVVTVSKGTFNIDTTGLSQFVIQGMSFYNFSVTNNFGYTPQLVFAGTGTDLQFKLANGSSAVPMLVNGLVQIGTGIPNYEAFSKVVVNDGGTLRVTATGALGSALPVDLKSGTLAVDANTPSALVTQTTGALSLLGRGQVSLVAKDAVSKFAQLTVDSLSRPDRGVLQVTSTTVAVNGGLNSQNQLKFNTAPTLRGKDGASDDRKIVDPYIVIADITLGTGDFATCDANGLKVATYSGTDITAATAGDVVNQTTAAALASPVSLYGLRLFNTTTNLTISGSTIKLGVLSDTPTEVRASQAGLIISSTTGNNSRVLTISAPIDLGTSELVAHIASYNLNSRAVLSGSVTGTGGLTKFGSGLLRLSNAANNLTGPVTIWDGILQINGGNGLSDSCTVYVGPGAPGVLGSLPGVPVSQFDLFNTATGTETIAGLSGSGSVTIASGKILEVKDVVAGSSFAGVISSTGNIKKSGTGTQTLSGVNTYTGATNITGGTLKIDGAGSINATSGITLNGADAQFITTSSTGVNRAFTLTQGTIGGTGTITTAITSGANGIIAPGDRTLTIPAKGTLTVQNALDLTGGTADFRLFSVTANDSDKLVQSTTGGLTYGGALKISDVNTSPFAGSNSWDLFDFATRNGTSIFSNDSVFGTDGSGSSGLFPTLSSGKTWAFDYTTGVLSIAAGSSNNSVITVDGTTSASATLATVTLGAGDRVLAGGGAVTSNQTLTKSNSDATTYTLTPSSGATASGTGSFAAGNQTENVTVGLDATTLSTVGVKSKAVTVANTGSGVTDANDTITVQTTAVASRAVTAPTTTPLGIYHAGATVNVTSNAFGSTWDTVAGGTGVNADTETGSVSYSGSADANGIRIATGSTTLDTNATFTRTFTGTAAVSSAGGSHALDVTRELSGNTTVSAAYTIGVYSGNMKWNGASANWSTDANWNDSVVGGAHFKPGLDAGYVNSDTAVFDGSGVGGVTLDASPKLKSIQFSGGSTSYALTPAATETITMQGSGASITASGSKSHVISAPISALSDLNLSQSDTASLTLGNIANAAATTTTVSGTVAANAISGSGSTSVLTSSSLTADSIVQNTLSIGAGGVVTIRETTGGAVNAVPEPGTWVLIGTALLGLLAFRRRRRG